ncbi:phage tail protein [Paenibacillus sp. JMULE4]|uniref:distal tail protein Dit n=1 Tax=Paenibacillus sp. JMULE4 TaxID=2518342 RepID=UPI001574FE83|nr:distal tail protein Dit [Paenibacillus sp. JMULE4]NTZ20939.1 phage tail protein [Paenibacillus sp. JMULE4]
MTAFIWLGDKSNEDFGFIVRGTSKRPALPSTVDRTLTIPGRNGQWDFGADMGPRPFVLDCAFITRNANELQQQAVALAAHLIDSYGKPRTLELRFRERPGQFFTVRFVGSFDIDRIIGTGVFSLPFTAFDPWANADAERIFEDTVTTSPYVTTIQSTGEIRTPPVIVLANQGPTTIQHFKIENEYLVEG